MDARKDATDLGKISLWIDERQDSKTLATGKITLYSDDGSTKEINVYLYDNVKKSSDKSPDYFGFLKAAEPKKTLFNKKVSPVVKPVIEEDNDESEFAF